MSKILQVCHNTKQDINVRVNKKKKFAFTSVICRDRYKYQVHKSSGFPPFFCGENIFDRSRTTQHYEPKFASNYAIASEASPKVKAIRGRRMLVGKGCFQQSIPGVNTNSRTRQKFPIMVKVGVTDLINVTENTVSDCSTKTTLCALK